MVDCGVVGCCWIELPKNKYRVRQPKTPGDMSSGNPSMVRSSSSCPRAPLYRLLSL